MKLPDLLRQFKQYCLIERGMTPRNYISIIRSLEMLSDYAGTENIKEFNENTIRGFLVDLSQQRVWSPKTFRNYLQGFSTFFQWCEKKGFVENNPTRKIEKPKIPKRLPRCITKEDSIKILYHTSWYPWYYKIEKVRNEAIITMFLYTGLRLRELLNLKFTDVCMESEEILVRQGKGGKDRFVPLHPRLAIVLRGYIQEQKKTGKIGQWFFTSVRSEKQLNEKNIYRIFRTVSRASGIKFTPHMLRHTFARLSIDADFNLFKLKEIMGHSCISTTQIYLSVSRKGIKRSFNELQLF